MIKQCMLQLRGIVEQGSAVAPCDGDVFRDDASYMDNSNRRHLGL
jgi:hypothetical protein